MEKGKRYEYDYDKTDWDEEEIEVFKSYADGEKFLNEITTSNNQFTFPYGKYTLHKISITKLSFYKLDFFE